MIRRDFLKLSSLASAASLTPRFLSGLGQYSLSSQGKKLVVIQLSGGNDGLNTIIPFRNDIYYQARPQLAIEASSVLNLTDELGLNPAMSDFKGLFDKGLVTILNQVGYPNPDRSHFRSMDIWHTASNSDEYWNHGWLGRYLDHSCTGCDKSHRVIEVDETLSLAGKGKTAKAMALTNPQRLYKTVQDSYLQELKKGYAHRSTGSGESELDYLYKTLTETVESAAYVYEKSKTFSSSTPYPTHAFGKQLKQVAELIGSGIETQVFYVSLTGFDTHVNQRRTHDRLLGLYSSALSAFVSDLTQMNRLDETLIMTFSEFGRRVQQNASRGTDHGKANSLFLVGGTLRNPGVFNANIDLKQLDEGDVKYSIDFRQVYATVLKDWLGADDQQILQRKFKRLELV